MRHQVVSRLTALLAGLVLLAALCFAWLVRDTDVVRETPGPAAREGAALFERYCTPCHAAADLTPRLQGDGALRGDWERLLASHGKASDDEDRLILDYLALNR